MLGYWMATLSFFAVATAVARVTRVNDCVMTIGNFCPLETIGATLAASLVLGLVVFGVRWLFYAATNALPKPPSLAQTIRSDPKFAAEIQHATGIKTWREALEKLPTDQYLVINGFNVWKLKTPEGQVYFSGDRNYNSIDEVLDSYKIR